MGNDPLAQLLDNFRKQLQLDIDRTTTEFNAKLQATIQDRVAELELCIRMNRKMKGY